MTEAIALCCIGGVGRGFGRVFTIAGDASPTRASTTVPSCHRTVIGTPDSTHDSDALTPSPGDFKVTGLPSACETITPGNSVLLIPLARVSFDWPTTYTPLIFPAVCAR